MGKLILVGMIGIFLIIISSIVYAEFWTCFEKGEKIDFCNPKIPDRTCSSNYGCKYCMKSYNETANCYSSGNWNVCLGIPQECSDNGNPGIDEEPPELTINSPVNNNIYSRRNVLMDLESNEEADIFYKDNNEDRENWKRICQNCLEYNNSRSFEEGENNITIKARDVVGNEAFFDVFFFIDSKEPKIKKTEPRRGFFGSIFYIEFQEENPSELFVNYGNNIVGFRNAQVDIEKDCQLIKGRSGKYGCNFDVDVEDYDGQKIEYWFNITDIAGNIDESKHITLDVDTSSPVINNPTDFYTINGRYVYFSINITEENFDSVDYIDLSDSRPRWRRLCSRLSNGFCEKKKNFRDGNHVVDIQVTDKAGNSISKRIEFEVV